MGRGLLLTVASSVQGPLLLSAPSWDCPRPNWPRRVCRTTCVATQMGAGLPVPSAFHSQLPLTLTLHRGAEVTPWGRADRSPVLPPSSQHEVPRPGWLHPPAFLWVLNKGPVHSTALITISVPPRSSRCAAGTIAGEKMERNFRISSPKIFKLVNQGAYYCVSSPPSTAIHEDN